MSSQEVTQLRKNGQLSEALKMGLEDYELDNQNIWNIRALAWVYYAIIKKLINEKQFSEIGNSLDALIALEVPGDETMFWNSYVGLISNMMYELQHNVEDETIINSSIPILQNMFQHIEVDGVESDKYDKLIVSLMFFSKKVEPAAVLCDLVDWEKVSSALFVKQKMKDGRLMPISNGESLLITYSKYVIDKGTVEQKERCIAALEFWSKKQIEQTYLDYFAVKIHISMGHNGEDVMQLLIHFMKLKSSEFWAWQLLADTLEPEKIELRLASLMRAASIKGKPEFLVKLNCQLARLLMQEGYYFEARKYYQKALKGYHDNMRRQDEINQILSEPVFQDTEKMSKKLDMDYMKLTNELVFEDVPKILVVVHSIYAEKKLLYVTYGMKKQSHLRVQNIKKFHIGDVLEISVINDYEKDGFVNYSSLNHIELFPHLDFLKQSVGNISIRKDNPFGFVDNIFVQPYLIKQAQCKDRDEIEYTALYLYNKKKKEWNWNCIDIKCIE